MLVNLYVERIAVKKIRLAIIEIAANYHLAESNYNNRLNRALIASAVDQRIKILPKVIAFSTWCMLFACSFIYFLLTWIQKNVTPAGVVVNCLRQTLGLTSIDTAIKRLILSVGYIELCDLEYRK